MNDQYDQLISLVRRLVDGECRGQGVLERGRSNAALAAWLREHDAREEVRAGAQRRSAPEQSEAGEP